MNRIETLRRMLAAAPTDAFLLFALAKEYEGIGNDDEAFSYYTACRLYNPEYVGLYYHLAKLYERRNEIEAAVTTYNEGIGFANEQNNRHAANEMLIARSEWIDDDY